MKYIVIFWLCFLMNVFCCSDTLSPASEIVKISIVTEDFPPYNYQVNGAEAGLSTEVVKAALEDANIEGTFTFYPWARAYEMAQNNNNTLIYSIARIPERESLFQWVGTIAPYNTSLYKLKKRTDIRVQSIDQINPYSVGISRDDVISQYLTSMGISNLVTVNRDAQNLHKLKFGRIDLLAYDEASFKQQILEEGLDPSMFERLFRLEALSNNLYMAFSNQTDTTIVERLQAALRRVKDKGIVDKILNKYEF